MVSSHPANAAVGTGDLLEGFQGRPGAMGGGAETMSHEEAFLRPSTGGAPSLL